MTAFGLELGVRDTLPEIRAHLELWPEELPDHGTLSDTPVALLLARARVGRVTGVLGLRGERFVYLSRGRPVFVDSVLTADTSEVHLVAKGVLRGRALDASRAVAAEQGSGVGEALLSMGVISATELFEHKRSLTRQRLVDCLGWRDGTARFEARPPFGSEIVPIPIDLAQVLAEGVALHYDERRLRRELPVGDSHRVYLTGPLGAAGGATLGALEARLLSRASARPSLAALAVDLGARGPALHGALFVLYHLGLIGFDLATSEARAPAARRDEQPEILRPRMPAPRSLVPAAALPVPGAARPPRPTPGPVVPELPVERAAAPRRALPPLGRPTRSAAGYLEDAELARDAGDSQGALAAMRYAHLVEPHNPVIAADLAFTFLVVDARAFAREAGRLARDARRANPSLPMPYVVLGMLMEQLRDATRAAQLYRYALARDPDCDEARARLLGIEERQRRR